MANKGGVKSNYKIKKREGGGFIIRIPRKGQAREYTTHYVPPDHTLLERYRHEMRYKGGITPTTRKKLQLRGICAKHEPRDSLYRGLEEIGITNHQSTQEKQCEASQRRATRLVRSFWPLEQVRRFMRDPFTVTLPPIGTFRKESKVHATAYKWIKGHGGMFTFLEDLRPGLYNRLTKKTNGAGIDLEKIGQELREIARQGIPIAAGYLRRDENTHRKRVFHQVEYVRTHQLLPRKYHTFNQIVARLTGISEAEITGVATGRKQCARIAQKFVEFYLTAVAKTGYDPLDLKLPPETPMYFDTDETKYTFLQKGKEKVGWTDGRLGNQWVEVKTGATPFRGVALTEFRDKYLGDNHWLDGQTMERGFAFFYQVPKFARYVQKEIEASGARFIDYETFHEALEDMLVYLGKNNSEVINKPIPRPNVYALLDANRSLSLEHKLGIFAHPGLTTQRLWIREMLEAMIDEVKK